MIQRTVYAHKCCAKSWLMLEMKHDAMTMVMMPNIAINTNEMITELHHSAWVYNQRDRGEAFSGGRGMG